MADHWLAAARTTHIGLMLPRSVELSDDNKTTSEHSSDLLKNNFCVLKRKATWLANANIKACFLSIHCISLRAQTCLGVKAWQNRSSLILGLPRHLGREQKHHPSSEVQPHWECLAAVATQMKHLVPQHKRLHANHLCQKHTPQDFLVSFVGQHHR